MFECRIVTDIKTLKSTWTDLEHDHHCPFNSFTFLNALQNSGCVDGQSGWNSHHLAVYDKDSLVAFMPMYEKQHSYGEYVFDWAWASAYREHGLDYYPKLVSAIPFSPVPGNRMLYSPTICLQSLLDDVSSFIKQHCKENDYSSFHLLLPTEQESSHWASKLLQRKSVQFHWHNNHYADINDFYAQLKSRKRKAIRKERLSLNNAGWSFKRITGEQLTSDHIHFFYQCYCHTYLKLSGHSGYLNETFFQTLKNTMSENMMLVVGEHNGIAKSAALFFVSADTLYGRYWGTLTESDGLHFETCYYQGIEHCIEHGIQIFNPGTQGEHKISRGFTATTCYSNHWLEHNQFHDAVADFLAREQRHIEGYIEDVDNMSPYRQENQE